MGRLPMPRQVAAPRRFSVEGVSATSIIRMICVTRAKDAVEASEQRAGSRVLEAKAPNQKELLQRRGDRYQRHLDSRGQRDQKGSPKSSVDNRCGSLRSPRHQKSPTAANQRPPH
jgi:hypothetical protein